METAGNGAGSNDALIQLYHEDLRRPRDVALFPLEGSDTTDSGKQPLRSPHLNPPLLLGALGAFPCALNLPTAPTPAPRSCKALWSPACVGQPRSFCKVCW